MSHHDPAPPPDSCSSYSPCMILVNYLQSLNRFYSWISTFHTWRASYDLSIVVFQFQFCDSTTTNTTKWQSGHKCVVNFNHRIISGSCPEPKTFYLLWIMLIHNFVLYNIIKTFCQAKQVLKAARKKHSHKKSPKGD